MCRRFPFDGATATVEDGSTTCHHLMTFSVACTIEAFAEFQLASAPKTDRQKSRPDAEEDDDDETTNGHVD